MNKYLIIDVRHYIVEAAGPQEAVDIYEDAREDYNEDEFEIDNGETYTVTQLSSLH